MGDRDGKGVPSLMNWDKDGDGNIDMDELAEGVASLGYDMKKAGRSAFKGSSDRGVI